MTTIEETARDEALHKSIVADLGSIARAASELVATRNIKTAQALGLIRRVHDGAIAAAYLLWRLRRKDAV